MSISPSPSVSWPQALSWRLRRHLLEPLGTAPVEDVVRRLGGVLAMDESLAELAVRVRRTRSRPGELTKALGDGRLVKAYSFRGSMHYLSPSDGGVYLALRAAGRQWELPSWQEYYRLTPADWPAFRAAVREALAHGPLTVAELGAAVTGHRRYRHLRPVFDDGAGTLVKPLMWQGDMSFGPPRDGKHTFQRLDTNPRWAGIPELDEAGRYAVAAYVGSYGPATHDHVQYWLGSCLSAGRRRIQGWLRDLGDRLAEVDVEGETRYVLREDLDELRATRPTAAVRLLPGHDQWVMGPSTKDVHVTPAERRDPVTRRANLVIAGGVVSGTWTVKDDEVAVTWLGEGPTPRTALQGEVERLAAIRGRSLVLGLQP